MTQLPGFATSALDARVHREESLTLARRATHQGKTRTAAPATPNGAPPNAGRRRVVLPDPVAFKFLEGDPSVTVVERRYVLPGYELYLVEQWACSRQSPTLVIATYTGDPKHSVVVGVLEVPADEEDWSPKLKVYFKAIHQYHARPKETELGELMVTNLSSFPSALTVIAVPEGDIRKHRQVFIVNENLKRLGCSGRSGLTLTEPTSATQAKFMQMYKTSDRTPFVQAVLELVKLCQVALFLFGMLEEEYIDGLLCDVTEKAVNDWWTEIGSEYFNIEPTDGILGPTTVAALLGTLLGSRNRLSYYGAPVSKDAFDVESMTKGIGTFQKAMRLKRTRRLDRQTLLKLHSVTAKAAAGEGGWGVQKAVKSTVAEIGGKRGELVIGMVGGRDKANIGDIETLDLAKFISLVYGERPKWLWHGKPRRTLQESHYDYLMSGFGQELRDDVDPQLGGRRAQSAPVEDEVETKKREDSPSTNTPPQTTNSLPISAEASAGDRDALRKTVFKSVAGKVSDARSGLGRIRDAVGGGLRGHVSRPSKDETPDTALSGYSSSSLAMLAPTSTFVTSPIGVGKAFTWKAKPDECIGSLKDREVAESAPAIPNAGSINGADEQSAVSTHDFRPPQEQLDTIVEKEQLEFRLREVAKEVRSTNASVARSVVADGDLEGRVLALERSADGPLLSLQHRHSLDCIASLDQQPNEARLPRCLSFSAAEDAILGWEELVSLADTAPPTGGASNNNMAGLQARAELSYSLYTRLRLLQRDLAPWVSKQVGSVTALDRLLDAQQGELQHLLHEADERYQRARHGAGEAVGEERGRLAEAVKDVEMLAAKLEYEMGALVSRVAEVEDGVALFGRQVEDVERRADELRVVLETESWVHWFVRTVTGIGTGPNITRGL